MKAHAAADLFPLLDSLELSELAADIQQHGQLSPIVMHEGVILDGRNRWRACELNGINPLTVEWDGECSSPTAYVLSVNLKRRHLDDRQREMAAARAIPLFESEAKQRMRAGKPAANWQQGRAAEQAAAALNVSARSVYRAAAVVERGDPDLVAAVDAGRIAVSTAADIANVSHEEQRQIVTLSDAEILARAKELRQAKTEKRRQERFERLATISQANVELPSGRVWPVIVADPPWRYENNQFRGAPEDHYPTMALEEICALPVASIATDDAVLFLWATCPLLHEALQVMAAWGFTYRSQFAWVKDRVGTGFWVRGQHELLLIGVRGEMPPPAPSDRPPSVINGPVREHSQKPDESYAVIERMFPTLPRVELFCRSSRAGWDVWGNQARAA